MTNRRNTTRARGMRRATLLAALLALAPSVLLAQAADTALPPAQQIIDRYVEAIGGEQAIASRTSIVSTGSVEMPAAGIRGDLLLVQTPDKMSVSMTIPGMGEMVTVYDGEVAWSINPMQGPRLVEGKELAALEEESGFASILRRSPHITSRETIGRTEMGGQACWQVRITYASGRQSTDCFSVETGLLVGSTQKQETPMGEIEVVTLVSEWKDFGGLKTATVLRQQMMGQEQVLRIDDVKYDQPEVAAKFVMPAAIEGILEAKRAGTPPPPMR